MADKYSTIQQHQPLRVPASFDKQGRALIVQLDEIFDDIYRRYGRLKVSDLGSELKDLCLLKDEDGKYVSIQTGIGTIQLEVGDIEDTMSSIGMTPDGIDISGGKYIKIQSGGLFEVNSANLLVDETSLTVKEGILKGDHYDMDGVPLMRRDAIVISTDQPSNVQNNTVWIKPLDSSVSMNYVKSVSTETSIAGFSDTLTTGGTVSDPSDQGYKYRLKFPVNSKTTSGSGVDVTVTVEDSEHHSITFSQHIPQGSSQTGFIRTFDQTATSDTWFGENASLSISMTIAGQAASVYKIIGDIEMTASYSGGSAGWKACEVKVYKE